MSLKSTYRRLVKLLEVPQEVLYWMKSFAVEWRAIVKKRALYKGVVFSKEQEREFDEFWGDVGLSRLSRRWHRLYQAINHQFNAAYVPDHLFSMRIEPALNPRGIREVLGDKVLAQRVYCGAEGVDFPKIIVAVTKGTCVDCDGRVLSRSQAIELMSSHIELVAKPRIDGNSGKGVRLCEINCDSSNAASIYGGLEVEYADGFIVQERVRPHPILERLSPSALSTIRVITFRFGGSIFHALSALRLGRGDSFVDNIHGGGLVVGVDDDGRLGGYAYELGYCDSTVRHEVHPESGIVFSEVTIPSMYEIVRAAKNMHGMTPELGMISWDMTLSATEDVVCIEANVAGQSVWFPQICNSRPLFGEHTHRVLVEVCRSQRGANRCREAA